MPTRERTLLIVEDDRILNTMFKFSCEEALNEIPYVKGNVKQAFNYAEAKQILDTTQVDFVSVDIALNDEETGRTDEKDRDVKEAGGMLILKELQKRKDTPLAIIVSGEKLLSYGIDAYSKYNVLAFYQKDKMEPEKYRNAVLSALFYLESADAISSVDIDINFLRKAEDNWQKSLEAAEVAGITTGKFPDDLGIKINLVRSERVNDITGLPEAHWTKDQLKKKVAWQDKWILVYVTIDGFNRFVNSNRSQELHILKFVGNILERTTVQFEEEKLFIGHISHQNYGSDPAFLVLSNQDSFHHSAESIANWIKNEFSMVGSKPFTRQLEIDDSQPEVEFALATKVIRGTDSMDPEELLDRIASISNESV